MIGCFNHVLWLVDFTSKGFQMLPLTSMLGLLMSCWLLLTVICKASLIFLRLVFCSVSITFVLFHCMMWSSFQECSAMGRLFSLTESCEPFMLFYSYLQWSPSFSYIFFVALTWDWVYGSFNWQAILVIWSGLYQLLFQGIGRLVVTFDVVWFTKSVDFFRCSSDIWNADGKFVPSFWKRVRFLCMFFRLLDELAWIAVVSESSVQESVFTF